MSIEKKFDDLVVIKSDMMGNNSYILINDNHCVVIDPSFSGLNIIEYIKTHKLILDAILLTHCHFDHSKTVRKIIDDLPCKVFIHKNDKETYEKYDYAKVKDIHVDKFDDNIIYYDFENLNIGNFKIKSFLTPGHTAGCVTFKYNNYLFTGDCLFADNYGRTDLANSNDKDEINSVKFILNKFDENSIVFPGHGPEAILKDIRNFFNQNFNI